MVQEICAGDMVLEGLERDAREARKGLWGDPAPIPPWVCRKARRGNDLDSLQLIPLTSDENGSHRDTR